MANKNQKGSGKKSGSEVEYPLEKVAEKVHHAVDAVKSVFTQDSAPKSEGKKSGNKQPISALKKFDKFKKGSN